MQDTSPTLYINASAPLRICDIGGWTDTWFAGHGQVFNIAVMPCAEVQIAVYPKSGLPYPIILNVLDFDDRYPYTPGAPWERHPLLEATISLLPPPTGCSIEISLHCAAPSGASIGTSAAVCVAMLGALAALVHQPMSVHQIAYAAHRVETELLGQQSGIQDQLCSAYGGVNTIEVFDYPQASVRQVPVADQLSWELERRLALIYLGKSHQSSQVHQMVIANLERSGKNSQPLEDLRQSAVKAQAALAEGNLTGLGQAMIENTDAQIRLNPGLVSQDAHRIIEIAHKHHASGWKVNGAGGEGGSLTILSSPELSAQEEMLANIQADNALIQIIPIQLSRYGLRVWKQELKDELPRKTE